MFSWNSPAFSMLQWMLAIWCLLPLPFLKSSLNIWNIWKFSVPVLLKHLSRFTGLSPQLRHVLPEYPLPIPRRARCDKRTALFICFTSLRNHYVLLPVAQWIYDFWGFFPLFKTFLEERCLVSSSHSVLTRSRNLRRIFPLILRLQEELKNAFLSLGMYWIFLFFKVFF